MTVIGRAFFQPPSMGLPWRSLWRILPLHSIVHTSVHLIWFTVMALPDTTLSLSVSQSKQWLMTCVLDGTPMSFAIAPVKPCCHLLYGLLIRCSLVLSSSPHLGPNAQVLGWHDQQTHQGCRHLEPTSPMSCNQAAAG
jgi:hypothetical protein